MERKYKAAIFDLDGVIVDTARFHYAAWKNIAAKLGYEFTLEQNELLKGVSRMESMNIVAQLSGKALSEEEKLTLATEKNQEYVRLIDSLTPNDILPGILELLIMLREKGVKIVLGSASKNASLVLNKLDVVNLFDAIVDGTTVSNAKPDPEVFIKGAELCGVPACNCIVFEDAIAGIEAAMAGGMYAVGVGSPQTLSKADFVVQSLDTEDVKSYLSNLFNFYM